MANFFENIRLRGIKQDNLQERILEEDGNYLAIKQTVKEELQKGMSGKEVSFSQPVFQDVNINPEFKQKPSYRNIQDLHKVLKRYGKNIILNAIINTRSSQVAMYCQPTRFTDRGTGFEVVLKDRSQKPSKADVKRMSDIENFILNTGVSSDVVRGNFTDFCKKIIRDTYRFDQVNYEKVFTKRGNLHHLKVVDPTTIFIRTDEKGKIITKGTRYVQVLDDRVVARFNTRELAFSIRNPRSDIEGYGYGVSELEIALNQFIAQENTEKFNDRFFSHGGTTRGVLQIQMSSQQQQSAHALDIFRKQWKSSLSGISGSWQIPVVSAEDVKFVNMTPNSRDMEFEKWLNYLINVISSLYGIDPAEINFPNNGGATGSKGGALNEGNAKEKNQASQNKGLLPLLRFIENTINDNIMIEFGSKYQFRFVGGDNLSELDKVKIVEQKIKNGMTVNEGRKEMGLIGDIVGGDVPLSGVVIQRIGQLMQQEQFEYSKAQERLAQLRENLTDTAIDTPTDDSNFSNGEALDANNVGKDGQLKDEENANSAKQGMRGENPNDWQKEQESKK